VLAGNDRVHDPHPGHAGHVRHRRVQLHVHLPHCLLHALDLRRLLLNQGRAVPHTGAQPADFRRRPERCRQQTAGVQLLQPLAVQPVGLASAGHVLRVPGVHEAGLQTVVLQHLVQRDPVHARRLHGHRAYAALQQPRRDRFQFHRVSAEAAHPLPVVLARNADPHLRGPHINAGCIRVDHLEQPILRLTPGRGLLHVACSHRGDSCSVCSGTRGNGNRSTQAGAPHSSNKSFILT